MNLEALELARETTLLLDESAELVERCAAKLAKLSRNLTDIENLTALRPKNKTKRQSRDSNASLLPGEAIASAAVGEGTQHEGPAATSTHSGDVGSPTTS
jgi:hypothetical protein